MIKGDIVLVSFPFTDLSGSKLRPALVIAETGGIVTVVFITTQLRWQDYLDVVIEPDNENGIKRSSLLRISRLATLDKGLVIGKLGHINREMLKNVDEKLKAYLQIS